MKRINALYQVDDSHDGGDDCRAALLWYGCGWLVVADSHNRHALLVLVQSPR